jgi:hypothetical protein
MSKEWYSWRVAEILHVVLDNVCENKLNPLNRSLRGKGAMAAKRSRPRVLLRALTPIRCGEPTGSISASLLPGAELRV